MANATTTSTRGSSVDVGTPVSDVVRREGALSPGELARQVMERFRATYNNDAFERKKIWPRNLLYAYGQQDLAWDPDNGQWLVRRATRVRRAQTNLLMSRIGDFVAQLTQHRPALAAVPLSQDLVHVRQARLGERLFAFDWRDLQIGRARYYAMLDAAILGTGILEAGYDPTAGGVEIIPQIQLDQDLKPLTDKMGNPVPVMGKDGRPVIAEARNKGRLFVRAISPFSFFTPPGVEVPSLRECPWVIRVTFMSEECVRQFYAKDGEFQGGLVTKKTDLGRPSQELDIEPMRAYMNRYQGFTDRAAAGEHTVVEYFQRATDVDGFERGKILTVVNKQLVGDRPSWRENGEYPFFAFPWMPRRGRFWSAGWIDPQIGPQERYNNTLSHLSTLLALISNPAIMIPRNSGLPQTLVFQLQGYYYNAGVGPASFLTPPAPNNAIYEMANRALQDLDRAGGQYAFSRGEPVPNVPSALYAQIMQDKDNTGFGPAVREHALSIEELGGALVELHHQFDDEERLLHIVGETNRVELLAFKGSDMPSSMRFVAQESSMYSSLPAAQLARVKDLMAMGLIAPKDQPVPPAERKALLAYAQMPELVDVESGSNVIDKFVERTLADLIEMGKDVQISPLWNPKALEKLSEELETRVLREDVPHWDQPTVQRVMQFQQELSQAMQAVAQAQEKEQDRQTQKTVDVQEQLVAQKSRGKVLEKVTTEAAKAGLEVIKAQAMPPPAAGAPPNGNGGPPEPPDQGA